MNVIPGPHRDNGRPTVAFLTKIPSSAILISFLVLSPQSRASATDCAALRDIIKTDQQLMADATAHLQKLKPRVDAMNKKLDDLTVRQTDVYLTKGIVDPALDKQIENIRDERNALTRQDQDEIRQRKASIAHHEQQMQDGGCPTESKTTAAKPQRTVAPLKPRKVPGPVNSQPLDTSGMTGAIEHKLLFMRGNLESIWLSAPADYRWVKLDGGAASGFFGHYYYYTLECPVKITGNSYVCNVSMRLPDWKVNSSVVVGTASGSARVYLTLGNDYKSVLTINFRSVVVNDSTRSPAVRTEQNVREVFHEEKPKPVGWELRRSLERGLNG